MQLAEYFMWIDQSCGLINYCASISAAFILYLQATVVVVAGYYFNTFSGFITNTYIKHIMYAIIIVWFISAVIITIVEPTKLCSKETKRGHLEWKFPRGTIEEQPKLVKLAYYGFLLLPWLFLKNRMKGRLIVILLLLPLLYFRFNFQDWESIWCLFSVSMPALWLIVHKHI